MITASISITIDWVTFEDAHVAEFRDTTERAPPGKQIIQMLLDGELDAVLGEKVERQGSEAAVCGRRARKKNHGSPNTMWCRSTTWWWSARNCRRTNPQAVREVSRMLKESAAWRRSRSPCRNSAPTEMSRSLALISKYSAQQGLIPRAFTVDELFDDLTRRLR